MREPSALRLKVSVHGRTEEGIIGGPGRKSLSPNSVIGFLEIATKNEALFRAQVQIAGEALRISARVLQAAIKQESQVYLPLFGHSHILNKQVVQTVVCHHFHNIDQRLARWLLLVHDRTRDGAFNITYEAKELGFNVLEAGAAGQASRQSRGTTSN